VGQHFFVSYSRIDAKDDAYRLTNKLAGGPRPHPAWLADSVRDYSTCEQEWAWALKYKKPVIPLRFDPEAELPFRLASRQYIDFVAGFDSGLARLRDHVDWMASPAGLLRELRFRLADAEREMPRAGTDWERARIKQDLHDLQRRIADQERVVADPVAAGEATRMRINAALEVQREPERPRPQAPARARFVNAPPVVAPPYFQGRQAETAALAASLLAEDTRLVTVVGRGGVGKTALVCRLLRGLETGRLPDDLDAVEADGIVYLRTPSEHPVNFPNLYADLCRLLPTETADRLTQRYHDPHATPAELTTALLDAFPTGRWVVLLDNFEDLIDATGAITDSALDEALRTVLTAPRHGVKIVVTTRVGPKDLSLHHPGAQRRIDLEDGLPSPYAEQLLRARDPEGRLGLRDAPDALLSVARERTRGYPRALEALAAILSADRSTTLPELLDQTARLPDNVVEALVGEAFLRLDPLAQQVMQALAIFPVPVAAVAVDYLLQPHQPAVDAAPILSRLLNMQFVRRDASRYSLHQVDRDYTLGRIPDGELADRDAHPPPFSRAALRERGAAYFAQIRTPRAQWRTLDDLAPQLAEFDLRCEGGDFDTAAQVLRGIDFDYLTMWGHYRLGIHMHSRLIGHLADPRTRCDSTLSLGSYHRQIGEFARAIDLHEQSLVIARETDNRPAEVVALGELGICYAALSRTRQAIELHQQALAIARTSVDRTNETANIGSLANRYADLGETRRAIRLYEQVLTLARASSDRNNEATALCNLGHRYAELGDTRRAIQLHEQSRVIHEEIGDRYGEAIRLSSLGLCCADIGDYQRAVEHHRQAIEIADAIGSAQAQAGARRDLVRTQLWVGDLPAARWTATDAAKHHYPPDRAAIALMSGIIDLCGGDIPEAEHAFGVAAVRAEEQLQNCPDLYEALDVKALALAGLTLTGPADRTADAIATFRAARARTSAAGIVARVLRDLDALAPADPTNALHPIRLSAAGKAG
jgi:tetratricopeptide (TPR) repeat protein